MPGAAHMMITTCRPASGDRLPSPKSGPTHQSLLPLGRPVVSTGPLTHTQADMRENRVSIWIALGLVIGGVLLLLYNLNVFGQRGTTVGAGLFVVGGAVFLGVFAHDRRQWWAAIPGCTLLGLALSSLLGPGAGAWSGLAFLGSIGVGFAIVYLSDREQWWALIPAGALLTVGSVSALPDRGQGGALFLGLAATFAVVALAPTPHGRQTWAWFPAAGLAVLAALFLRGVGNLVRLYWPVALILVGLFLVTRCWVRSRRP